MSASGRKQSASRINPFSGCSVLRFVAVPAILHEMAGVGEVLMGVVAGHLDLHRSSRELPILSLQNSGRPRPAQHTARRRGSSRGSGASRSPGRGSGAPRSPGHGPPAGRPSWARGGAPVSQTRAGWSRLQRRRHVGGRRGAASSRRRQLR